METNPTKENAPLAGEAKENQLKSVSEQYRGETGATHRQRVLAALRLGTLSTFEARRYLDVPHPAGRVQELRTAGHDIATLRTTEASENGRPHVIAVYVLRREARAC
jgi:hypothetical protein